ncbi:hypothetical protein [Scleromatobacter humisilvae]|uniref:Uncharacterized protein n=1 Tax=Scleromatobacter humisilvae TaxID=2897159 RepID=A0A9X1YGT0_9BURK|nr:hypothetical protein [Scleromatobacter humisilvae]MCK9686039.1 hypothetical protein [Scleromatobacter humisilvae]
MYTSLAPSILSTALGSLASLCAIASATAAPASQPPASAATQDPAAGPKPASTASTAAAHKRSADLSVLATGKDQPVARAAVELKIEGDTSSNPERNTGNTGEVTFKSVSLGSAKVRILAAGWVTAFCSISIKEGAQRLTVNLRPLPDPKPAEPADCKVAPIAD